MSSAHDFDISLQTRFKLGIEAVDTFRPRPVGAVVPVKPEEEYISPSQMPPEAVRKLREKEAQLAAGATETAAPASGQQ